MERLKTDFLISCEVCESYLPGYMQGVLKPESRTIIQAHLAVCDRCWDKLTVAVDPDIHILYRSPSPGIAASEAYTLRAENEDLAWKIFLRERDHTIVLSIAAKRDTENLQGKFAVISVPSARAVEDELNCAGWVWNSNGPESIASSKTFDGKGHIEVDLATCLLNLQNNGYHLLMEKVFETIHLDVIENSGQNSQVNEKSETAETTNNTRDREVDVSGLRVWIGDNDYSVEVMGTMSTLLKVKGLSVAELWSARKKDLLNPGMHTTKIEGMGAPIITSLANFRDVRESKEIGVVMLPIRMAAKRKNSSFSKRSTGSSPPIFQPPIPILQCDIGGRVVEFFSKSGVVFLHLSE